MIPAIVDSIASPPVGKAVSVLAFKHPVKAGAVDRKVWSLRPRVREQFRMANVCAVRLVGCFHVAAVVFTVTFLIKYDCN